MHIFTDKNFLNCFVWKIIKRFKWMEIIEYNFRSLLYQTDTHEKKIERFFNEELILPLKQQRKCSSTHLILQGLCNYAMNFQILQLDYAIIAKHAISYMYSMTIIVGKIYRSYFETELVNKFLHYILLKSKNQCYVIKETFKCFAHAYTTHKH